MFLLAVWAAARLAVRSRGRYGWLSAAIMNSSFLFLVMGAAAREVMAGRNWANLKVLLPLSALALGDLSFHIEAHLRGSADYSIRIGIAAVVVLIMLIGGRIIPSFTRNWLVRENPGRLPNSIQQDGCHLDRAERNGTTALDRCAIWTGMRLACDGCCIQTVRLARWAGDRSWRDRLVMVLHVGYGFVPLGFALCAFGAAGLVAQSAGLHAWMVGAAGLMTLAVMTRASLGHTGRELKASFPTQCIYAFALTAAVARICAAFDSTWSPPLLHAAALAWAAAFLGFGIVYGPILVRPKKSQAV